MRYPPSCPPLNRLLLPSAVLVVLLAGFRPGVASAHALLERSDPAPDVILRSSPPLVHLWFSEDLNGSASRIVVWDRYRHVMNRGDAALVPGQSRQLEVRLKQLPPGSYLVLWTSVSAQDGHVLRGSYLFSVKVRGPGPSLAGVPQGGTTESFPDAARLAAILAHWIELLAAVTWVGTLAFVGLVLPATASELYPSARRVEQMRRRHLQRGSLIALIVASGGVLALQAYALANNDWGAIFTRSTVSEVFAAQYGQLWIGRQLLVCLTLLATFVFGAGPRAWADTDQVRIRTRVSSLSALAIGLVYLYLLAASGHAASANVANLAGSHILSGAVALDWLHLVGTALWFGGQIYIAMVLIPTLQAARDIAEDFPLFLSKLNRFSPAAYVSVAIFTLTGAFNGVIHIPSWYAYFHSVYGWALITKITLVGLMMLTSTYTVYWLRPHIRRNLAAAASAPPPSTYGFMRRLLRWLKVNPALGAGVVLATSVMFYYPVPFGLSPPGASSYTVRNASLIATLSIKPDRSGPNQVTVVLRSAQGQPVSQAHIVILTTMLDMVMGTGLIPLQETANGRFQGSGDLGMGGRWHLELLIYQPSGLTRMFVDARVAT